MNCWALAVAALVLFTGCSQGDQDAAEVVPEPLTATKAGVLYLSAVCPVNDAWDELDIEVDRLRIAQSRGERDTDAFADAMREVSSASERAAKKLEPKDKTWPKSAVDEIEAVSDSLRADAKQAEKVAKLPLDEAVAYTWKDAAELGEVAAEARLVLGLPADPVVACAQWAEQEAEAEAKAKADEKTAADEKVNKSADKQ